MLRTIVIALDGSHASNIAADYGFRLAKAPGAAVIGVSSLDVPSIRKPSYEPLGGGAFREARDKAMLEDAKEKVQAFLAEFRDRAAQAGVPADTRACAGAPEDEIAHCARGGDVIVIGRDTQFHFETEDPPDTVAKLVAESPRPIVVVPPRIDPGKGVLVAYDDSATAARALQIFVSLSPVPGAKVHVLGLAPEITHAEKMIAPAMEYLRSHGVDAVAAPVASKARASEVIREEASRRAVELIVMGSRGHSRVKEMFMGSTAKELLGHKSKLEIPVFVYR